MISGYKDRQDCDMRRGETDRRTDTVGLPSFVKTMVHALFCTRLLLPSPVTLALRYRLTVPAFLLQHDMSCVWAWP